MEVKKKETFRKVALERLSSPDKLDQLIQVVSNKAWLVLSLIIALAFAIILWGIFGEIAVKINAEGVLLRSGGVLNVYSTVNGTISDVAVRPGSNVDRGDVVARILIPEILNDIYILNNQINDEKVNYDNQLKHFDLLQEQANFTIANLKERLQNRQILFDKGLLTKDKVLETSSMLQAKIAELDNLKIQRTDAKNKIDQLNDRLYTLHGNLVRQSRVVTPYSGKVIEVKVNNDQLVSVGTKIISLELTGKNIKDLEAILYVNFTDGKKIMKGMDAMVIPNIVKVEEFGSMVGKVTSISKYPLTIESMVNELGDEELVKKLTETGPKYKVIIDLEPSTQTISGYKWTSSAGPPVRINSGTLCSGTLILMKRSPISFVLPFLKKTVGID
ncbi:NHLP bacteriocin system secretion protein [Legionella waltersii]|uniref:Colicin V secretion protein CvaA n=1 Tax=Legionella waltersii TaxID=66969 RepID=A0A0W1A299_9GAMM|nr:NHLP bacteriocin system secretion protein [Legionella waltersii]KTD75489.1 Colicin V secretion protein CvaA [Legionella waltersii]SNU98287.1 Colicin V secretion protein CvaA [Legionella waltersii]